MECPHCGRKKSTIVDKEIVRWRLLRIRKCHWCKQPYQTEELVFCPNCNSMHTTIDGKVQDMGTVVSRYRRCNTCLTRFQTHEGRPACPIPRS